MYRETKFWDLELCPLWRGLLYYVIISEVPLYTIMAILY